MRPHYLQLFAQANPSQQEVYVCLDNVEAGATDEQMTQAPDMGPGRTYTKDGTALTNTVSSGLNGVSYTLTVCLISSMKAFPINCWRAATAIPAIIGLIE